MQLLELPLDVFKIIITFLVQQLRFKSLKARLTCHTFATEILHAVIVTRVIEDVTKFGFRLDRVKHQPNIIARYLYHRICTDSKVTHPWITTIRESCRTLEKHANSEKHILPLEMLERGACLCLAINAGSDVFEVLQGKERNDRTELEGGTWANCLALAAFLGDMMLIKSLHKGSDPPSFFGRPSWAAAAQGHANVLRFLLDQGALPYEPNIRRGYHALLCQNSLGVAAYNGHEEVVQLLLNPPYFTNKLLDEEEGAILYAAEGNQSNTLKILLQHCKENFPLNEYLYHLDGSLLFSSRRGAPISTRILLDYGADVNETTGSARSSLQLAAVTGDVSTVKMLLDAGASIDAPRFIHRRTNPKEKSERSRKKDALTEAKRRDHFQVVKLIEDKQREINEGKTV